MSRWFRLYDEMLDDPKAQRLPAEDFKAWINLLCLASRNDGKLPCIGDIAFALRIDENGALTLIERLYIGGLIDKRNGGPDGFHYAPHAWERRQYKSDNSAERVRRHREKRNASCNVTETVTVTPPETDTETDTDTDINPPTPLRGIELPNWLPMDAWRGWIEMRAKRKKPLTDRARARALNKLETMLDAGQDIAEVLDRSTMNGWTDLYEIKEKTNGNYAERKDGVAAELDRMLGLGQPARNPERPAALSGDGIGLLPPA